MLKTPKNELAWVRYRDKDGNERFLMTSRPARDLYYLYEVKDGAYVRLGKGARTPKELEDKHRIDERLRI